MTAAAAVLPPVVVKEIRALFPTYAAALVAIVVGSFSHSYTLILTGLLGFAFGSVALGAQSFGHEYSHRTLGLLLSQPLDRRRLLLYKLGVLLVMLLTLTAATLFLFEEALQRAASPHTEPAMFVLAAACGLCVAPWLSLLCRSTLAAAVFTVAIPGVLATAGDLAGAVIYGVQNAAQIDRLKLLVFWRGMFLVCAVGAVAGWRQFMRLEVIEGRGQGIELPESLAGLSGAGATTPSRPRHRVRMLLAKELRLQQMAFVVAALFAALWLTTAWLERTMPEFPDLPPNAMSMFYAGVLAMLIGSHASAEERHLGTLEWQILLPMAAWRQWALKVMVALGLVLLLAVGLPALLEFLTPGYQKFVPRVWLQVALIAVPLTAGCLYLSTLCRSGVSALVLSLPSLVATFVLTMTLGETIAPVMFRLSKRGSGPYLPLDGMIALLSVIGAGLVALLLWLGFLNHRSADRSMGRTAKQVLGITGYITVALMVVIVLGVG